MLIAFPFYYLAIEALRDRFTTPWRYRPPMQSEGVGSAVGPSDDDAPGSGAGGNATGDEILVAD